MFERLIDYRAATEPNEVAISTPAGEATFASFHLDIVRMARRLQPIAPSRGHVTVQTFNPALHWVVTMALVRLGCVTSSLPPIPERPEAELLGLLRPDLFLTDKDVEVGCVQTFRLSPAWVAATFETDYANVPARMFEPDDPVRIVLSSGTTGTPKTMMWTRALIDARLLLGGFAGRAGRPRQHFAVGLDSESGFRGPLAVWMQGGATLYAGQDFSWPDFLLEAKPTTTTMVPAELDSLLRSLPPDFPLQPGLRVSLISGALPPGLAARVKAQLTPNVAVAYGSTEAGAVAMISAALLERNPGIAGLVMPIADVQIVDHDDRPLATGMSGRVRVRSPGAISGYLNDHDLTRRTFKDGWFYPGDLGSLSASSMLTIEGRESEVLYLGGMRIAPDAIEAVVLECAGVADAAAFTVPGEEAGATAYPCVALRQHGELDLAAISDALARRFPQLTIGVVVLDQIPRSERGKIQRDKVRDLALAQVGEPVRAVQS